MCLLCNEIDKKTMTPREVALALMETEPHPSHTENLIDAVDRNYSLKEVTQAVQALRKERK